VEVCFSEAGEGGCSPEPPVGSQGVKNCPPIIAGDSDRLTFCPTEFSEEWVGKKE